MKRRSFTRLSLAALFFAQAAPIRADCGCMPRGGGDAIYYDCVHLPPNCDGPGGGNTNPNLSHGTNFCWNSQGGCNLLQAIFQAAILFPLTIVITPLSILFRCIFGGETLRDVLHSLYGRRPTEQPGKRPVRLYARLCDRPSA